MSPRSAGTPRRGRTNEAVLDRLSHAVVAMAVLVFAWQLVGAVRDDTNGGAMPGDAPTSASASAERPFAAVSLAPDSTPPAGHAEPGLAIAHNPFSPERRPPGVRFRLLRDAEFVRGDEDDPDAPRVVPPVVLGTAVAADGRGFAMCTWGDAPPVAVRSGDVIGPFTVERITRGRVTFRDTDGRTLEIDAPDRSAGDPP